MLENNSPSKIQNNKNLNYSFLEIYIHFYQLDT